MGWTTRYWPAKKFKIEAYCDNSVGGQTGWIVVADVNNFNSSYYYIKLPEGAYSQLRFTFIEGTADAGANNKMGLSELVFIHPEVVTPYVGLFSKFNNLSEVNNNILIGKTTQSNTSYKLDVAGKIRANEIIVNTTGADFVFESNYDLRRLNELEAFIKEHKHLPEILSADEMQENGISVGEMQAKLLQKIEELTLYILQLKKENEEMKVRLEIIENNQVK